jgi:hypothetical protein
MEPNPYKSPVIPSDSKRDCEEPDGAIRLLTEIRDMQQEMLVLSRQNTAINRYAMFFVLGVGGIGIIALVSAGVAKILMPSILPNF